MGEGRQADGAWEGGGRAVGDRVVCPVAVVCVSRSDSGARVFVLGHDALGHDALDSRRLRRTRTRRASTGGRRRWRTRAGGGRERREPCAGRATCSLKRACTGLHLLIQLQSRSSRPGFTTDSERVHTSSASCAVHSVLSPPCSSSPRRTPRRNGGNNPGRNRQDGPAGRTRCVTRSRVQWPHQPPPNTRPQQSKTSSHEPKPTTDTRAYPA